MRDKKIHFYGTLSEPIFVASCKFSCKFSSIVIQIDAGTAPSYGKILDEFSGQHISTKKHSNEPYLMPNEHFLVQIGRRFIEYFSRV